MVRDPGVALYGLERLDLPEEKLLASTPLRSYLAADILRRGVAATARAALDRIHGGVRPFVLHFDVDVSSSEDFSACAFPGEGGLRLSDVREALALFLAEPQLLAVEISEYLPQKDPDASGAKLLVEMIASALAGRLAALTAPNEAPKADEPATEPKSELEDSGRRGAAATSDSTEPAVETHPAEAAAGEPSGTSS